MDSSLVLCSQSAKRTPSQAQGKETPLDTSDSMLLAEKDLVTSKHLCCCGDRGPRGSPSASLESEAGERPQEGPQGSPRPSTYPVFLFSLLKAWLPSLETGQGCTKQAGLSKPSRAGADPLGSPCSLCPSPAPQSTSLPPCVTSFPERRCPRAPRGFALEQEFRRGGTQEGKRGLQSFNRKEEEGAGGRGRARRQHA